MAITFEDVMDAYDNATKDPIQNSIIELNRKKRRSYNGRVAYLDDCGEGDTPEENRRICNRCSNRFECLKRWE